MKNQEKFNQILETIKRHSLLLTEDSQKDLAKRLDDFEIGLEESSYIKVPLVGVFSAGKSSLLNIFTQKPGMLPVDTAPETAVAYELYYGPQEAVELYRKGKLVEEKPLAEIKQLNCEPGDIAKVYCKSESIKELQKRGIILVDMPGIGSGIERHDAAIFNYIHSGTAFILIVDVEQGSLRSTTMHFMQELSQYNMHPAVLVSKVDKKPENDVKDIVEYIEYQMTKFGDTHPFISTVCAVNNNLEGLNCYLATLDPDALMAQKLGKKMAAILKIVIDQLKLRVELRSKDVSNVDEKLRQIEDEIAKVKVELPTGNSNADTPEKSTQDVLDNIKETLEAKSSDIAQMIIDNEDSETIKAAIISIVRAELIASLREESEQYSSALNSAVQEVIKDLATIEINEDFLKDFGEIYNQVLGAIEVLLNAGSIWGQMAKILLPFLPDVLNWLFGKSESEVLEEVRSKVLNKCVYKIVTALQPTVFKITVENQKRIQEKIQEELVARMENVKDGLREKLEDANKTKEEVSAEIDHLSAAISELQACSESI